jgi:hypothetical protein
MREPIQTEELRTCSGAGVSWVQSAQNGNHLLSNRSEPQGKSRRGRRRGATYKFSSKSGGTADVSACTADLVSGRGLKLSDCSGSEDPMVGDEFLQGLMLQAVEEALERRATENEEIYSSDTTISGWYVHEGEGEEEDTFVLNTRNESPRAFSGKKGIVFGYWSKAPYG